MATQYERGRQFEYRVKKDLEKRGYFVIRAAQSKGVADLVAVRAREHPFIKDLTDVLFIQCKLTGICGHIEWNLLLSQAGKCAARPVLATQEKPRSLLQYLWIMKPKEKGKGWYEDLSSIFTP